MKQLKFYNTAHPLAESGKPIFIPFGEWRYDDTRRQKLDREHGERIANELNDRVARGEPGIPVYQGHPDVPELAAKYPDKGALGWVTRIELANEGGRDGLALTVEWDRDPGKGFKWFSPYWFANESERQGNVHVVGKIASIGLVNNPNIAEFRLANEAGEDLTRRRGDAEAVKLPPHVVELAAKFDRLANEANFDESKHPRANDGKFTSVLVRGDEGEGGGEGGGYYKDRTRISEEAAHLAGRAKGPVKKPYSRAERAREINDALSFHRSEVKGKGEFKDRDWREAGYNSVRAAHRAAMYLGLTYNRTTHRYE